ncbi:MAG: hypothetical protein BBJ57_10140 [Desulfobacterales bacterium PC51MH44]|nr:MAG: hypothetical protein BBJ57_10140 [Desulfobacterales bacterium PC51MH44]
MEHFVQTLVNSVTTGMLYGCIAIGFTLIFGIIQLIYFAQCEMAMLGAFTFAGAYTAFRFLPQPLAIILSFVIASLTTLTISCLGERLLLSPIRSAPKVKGLIVSLGLSIVLQNIVLLCISPNELAFPFQIPGKYNISGITVTYAQLCVISCSLVTWLFISSLLYRTRLGRSIRAVAQSRDGAMLMGISVNQVITITFAVAAVTAAVSGILMGLYNGQMRFDMGFVPGIKGFTVAILGGIGNIKGALVAGLLLGLGEGLFAGYFSSDYKDIFAFVLLICVLLVRPHGVLGEGS